MRKCQKIHCYTSHTNGYTSKKKFMLFRGKIWMAQLHHEKLQYIQNRIKPLTKMTVGELKDVLQERTLKAY